jgi:hypothetical protein
LPDRDLKFLSTIGSIFSQEEIAHLAKQSQVATDFSLSPLWVKQRIIETDSMRRFRTPGSVVFLERYSERYGESGFCAVTRPYFTIQGDYAVVNLLTCAGHFVVMKQYWYLPKEWCDRMLTEKIRPNYS